MAKKGNRRKRNGGVIVVDDVGQFILKSNKAKKEDASTVPDLTIESDNNLDTLVTLKVAQVQGSLNSFKVSGVPVAVSPKKIKHFGITCGTDQLTGIVGKGVVTLTIDRTLTEFQPSDPTLPYGYVLGGSGSITSIFVDGVGEVPPGPVRITFG